MTTSPTSQTGPSVATSSTAGRTAEQYALYLAALRADSDRMLDVVTDLEAPVPACPGWTVRDALVHTGSVFSHKVACMRLPEGPQQLSDWDQGPAEGADLDTVLAWFRERRDELVEQLETRGPDASAYTWYDDDQTVGFWYRRMAQEVAVHRVDVESGTGMQSPVGHDLAVDGIDEVLDWFLRYQADDVGPDGPGRGTVAVRTGDHIWRVTLNPDDIDLSREPGPSDALVTGEASELYLWLWGRRPDDVVRVEGDTDLLAGFRARLQVVTT
jgi:uncharacterized protein (TIGR03083 family)